MDILKEIIKALKKVVLALLIILLIFYIALGFVGGVFDKKSIKNLSAEEIKLVVEAYGLNIPNDVDIKRLDSYVCVGNRYYVLKINNVKDITEFKSLNPHINIYEKVRFDFRSTVLPNEKYAPNYENYKEVQCFYKGGTLYISVYPFCEEYGRDVMDVFDLLIEWGYKKYLK